MTPDPETPFEVEVKRRLDHIDRWQAILLAVNMIGTAILLVTIALTSLKGGTR